MKRSTKLCLSILCLILLSKLTNAQSGLRFVFLTSSSTPVPNGTNGVNNLKLLTVDQNGDVVLTDAPAGTGGIPVLAQNGLNNIIQKFNPTGKDELGGPLIRHTTVTHSNFDMLFDQTGTGGTFGVGDGLTAGKLLPDVVSQINTSVRSTGLEVLNYTPAISASSVGGYFNCFGTSNANQNCGISAYGYNNTKWNVGTTTRAGGVTSNSASPDAKNTALDATSYGAVETRGIYATAYNGSTYNIGAEIQSLTNLPSSYAAGVLGTCANVQPSKTTSGGFKIGLPNGISIGTEGYVWDYFTTTSKFGILGVSDYRNISQGNIAVAGLVGVNGPVANGYNLVPGNNIAVYGGFQDYLNVPQFNSLALNNYAGWFEGKVFINGDISGIGTDTHLSDAMFKTHIDTIANPLTILKQLKPKTFYFDTTNAYGVNFSSKKQYGFVAQDVQTVLPELVSSFNKPVVYDTAGNVKYPAITYKTLNYNAFIGLLAATAQKQQARIDRQDSIINQMAQTLQSCCSHNQSKAAPNTNNNATSSIDVELSDADVVVLNQNSPNPFAEQTAISYNIPKNTSVAQILFYDINGRQIKTVDVSKKGHGQLNVYANDLTNGIYSYTLIGDGKIIDIKKMIKQQ